MDQYDNIVLKYLKSISFVNQQNLTEETSHERIVCVEGDIDVSCQLNLPVHEPIGSCTIGAYPCSRTSDE